MRIGVEIRRNYATVIGYKVVLTLLYMGNLIHLRLVLPLIFGR